VDIGIDFDRAYEFTPQYRTAIEFAYALTQRRVVNWDKKPPTIE
jgi:hypothetical protein